MKMLNCAIQCCALFSIACNKLPQDTYGALSSAKKFCTNQKLITGCTKTTKELEEMWEFKSSEVKKRCYTHILPDDLLQSILTFVVACSTLQPWHYSPDAEPRPLGNYILDGEEYLQRGDFQAFRMLRLVCKRWYELLPMVHRTKWDYGTVLLTMETPEKLFSTMKSMLKSTEKKLRRSVNPSQKPYALHIAMPNALYLDFDEDALSYATQSLEQGIRHNCAWRDFATKYMELRELLLLEPTATCDLDFFPPEWAHKVWARTWESILPPPWEESLCKKFSNVWTWNWEKGTMTYDVNMHLLRVLKSTPIPTLQALGWKGGQYLESKQSIVDLVSFSLFPNLKHVDLYSGNCIDASPCQQDLTSYQVLPQLETLHIDETRLIISIPEIEASDDIGHNLPEHEVPRYRPAHWPFSNFPDMISNLKVLDLRFNDVDSGMPQLNIEVLNGCSSLKHLYLDGISLMGDLQHCITRLRGIATLALHVNTHCGLTKDLCQAWLQNNTTLKALTVSPCCLHPIGVTILKAMVDTGQLKTLSLVLASQSINDNAPKHRGCFLRPSRCSNCLYRWYARKITHENIFAFMPTYSFQHKGILPLPFCQPDTTYLGLSYLAQGVQPERVTEVNPCMLHQFICSCSCHDNMI